MLNIVTENIITFSRLSDVMCTGYKIITRETVAPGTIITHEEIIDNPKAPNLIKERTELEYNSKQKWSLSDDIAATATDSLSVWVNNVLLNTNQYTYSPILKMLTIELELNYYDLIEVEYDVDRIEIKRNSMNPSTYEIIPILKESYKIGQHVVL